MKRLLFEYAKLFRLPGLGGLSLAPVFGALSIIDTPVNITIKEIALLFVIGVFAFIYSFVSNDIIDIEVDRLSNESDKRPLVTGTISKKIAIIISIICIVGAFLISFIFFYRHHSSFNYAIICLILAAVFGTIYNVYGKKISSSAFLAAFSEGLLVLFGAFMISPDGTLSIFTLIVAILIFNQILFMTAVIGGLKDAGHDYLRNVKTIALALGVKITKDNKIFIPWSFKAFGLGIRFITSFIVFVPFIFYNVSYELWYIIFLGLLIVVLMYLSIKILNIKILDTTDPKILRLSGVHGIIRYSLFPVVLIPTIGIINGIILIIFPIIWYIIFTPFTGDKLFKKPM